MFGFRKGIEFLDWLSNCQLLKLHRAARCCFLLLTLLCLSRLLRHKTASDDDFVALCRLRRGAAQDSVGALLDRPVSTDSLALRHEDVWAAGGKLHLFLISALYGQRFSQRRETANFWVVTLCILAGGYQRPS
jgi:hypothetical protein